MTQKYLVIGSGSVAIYGCTDSLTTAVKWAREIAMRETTPENAVKGLVYRLETEAEVVVSLKAAE